MRTGEENRRLRDMLQEEVDHILNRLYLFWEKIPIEDRARMFSKIAKLHLRMPSHAECICPPEEVRDMMEEVKP